MSQLDQGPRPLQPLSSASRSLHLVERTPELVHLEPGDVDYLLTHHRSILQLLPTGQGDRYRLTTRGVAGVIVAPGCRLEIAPKIPLRNLFFLLTPEEPTAPVSDRVTPQTGSEVLNFLAGQLARQMRPWTGLACFEPTRRRQKKAIVFRVVSTCRRSCARGRPARTGFTPAATS